MNLDHAADRPSCPNARQCCIDINYFDSCCCTKMSRILIKLYPHGRRYNSTAPVGYKYSSLASQRIGVSAKLCFPVVYTLQTEWVARVVTIAHIKPSRGVTDTPCHHASVDSEISKFGVWRAGDATKSSFESYKPCKASRNSN